MTRQKRFHKDARYVAFYLYAEFSLLCCPHVTKCDIGVGLASCYGGYVKHRYPEEERNLKSLQI